MRDLSCDLGESFAWLLCELCVLLSVRCLGVLFVWWLWCLCVRVFVCCVCFVRVGVSFACVIVCVCVCPCVLVCEFVFCVLCV